MSEITRGAIGMPFEMAMESELSRRQFHSIAQALLGERDQLRAEIAGLKTGYQAYERVNAELKAEVEALRANSSLVVLLPELDSALEDLEIHGQHSDQGYRCLKDWYRKMDLACKAIDAAMGKGEQS